MGGSSAGGDTVGRGAAWSCGIRSRGGGHTGHRPGATVRHRDAHVVRRRKPFAARPAEPRRDSAGRPRRCRVARRRGCPRPGRVALGPTGSTGFTLATGHIAVTAASDLDLVVRVASLPPLDVLTDWHRAFERLPARVDCQIDLPAGALALAEVVKADRVLLKTRDGPVLVESHRLWP